MDNTKSKLKAKDKTKELVGMLEQNLEGIFQSGDFEKFLKLCNNKAFSKYSVNNIILIMSQLPTAEYVAGYKTWENEFGRKVKPGEKAIYILAPSKYKKKVKIEKEDGTEEEVEEERFRYKSVPVFDISQTDGPDIPNYMKKADSDVEDCDTFVDALSKYSGTEFKAGNVTKYDGKTGDITVNPKDSDMQIMMDLVYACAMKDMKPAEDKAYCRAVADGISYVVCNNYGFDETGTRVFAKMLQWSKEKETKELKKCLCDIQKYAKEMIAKLDIFISQKDGEQKT